ncbi:type VI secretion system-associated protein VasI [Pseudomonas mucidolens]|uniref:type VI secretion system-associated protein VasI n=1 Tax=Pseudomonas mucidolens TaxID=46679 RepID=UPI0030DDD9D3
MRNGWQRLSWRLCLTMAVAVGAQATSAAQDCPAIVSPLKRLECFDLAAGTPLHPPPVPRALGRVLPIVDLVQRNELKRRPEDPRFVLSLFPEPDNHQQQRVVISAPALGALPPRPYLAISCESNISRLQLVLDEPARPNKVRIQLFKDGRPVSEAYQWQVLDDAGLVVDAGRGLQAISLLRNMSGGQRLRLESDYPRLHGLVFDAQGLGELIEQERQVCRW